MLSYINNFEACINIIPPPEGICKASYPQLGTL